MPSDLRKIAVFYDGNYFLHVSNYYNYDHARHARLSIAGLHRFIEARVAQLEGVPRSRAKIVDSHYFRGRLNAQEAQQRGSTLYYDRVFDDILMSSGVTTHYSPLRTSHGRRHEKGIDVWLALEAFEVAMLRKLDVVVLIASDSDYVPLVRKLSGLGVRVVILGWDFEFVTDNGTQMVTRTSQDLLDTASYPLEMSLVIDDPLPEEAGLIDDLFVPTNPNKKRWEGNGEAGNSNNNGNGHQNGEASKEEVEFEEPSEGEVGQVMEAPVFSKKNGYGFIKYPPNNLFFHHTALQNSDWDAIGEDDLMEFTLTHNDRGQLVATDVYLLEKAHVA